MRPKTRISYGKVACLVLVYGPTNKRQEWETNPLVQIRNWCSLFWGGLRKIGWEIVLSGELYSNYDRLHAQGWCHKRFQSFAITEEHNKQNQIRIGKRTGMYVFWLHCGFWMHYGYPPRTRLKAGVVPQTGFSPLLLRANILIRSQHGLESLGGHVVFGSVGGSEYSSTYQSINRVLVYLVSTINV